MARQDLLPDVLLLGSSDQKNPYIHGVSDAQGFNALPLPPRNLVASQKQLYASEDIEGNTSPHKTSPLDPLGWLYSVGPEIKNY